jgi:ferric-dicitrate binding protein FerR (iron transport regulator)
METETAWRDGKLVFDDMSIGEIAKKLERRYGVTIRIDDKNIEQLHFRGVFRNETFEQAIKAIQLSANFKYTIKDDEVIIY